MLCGVKFVVRGRFIRSALPRSLSAYPVRLLPYESSHQVKTIVKVQHTGGSHGDESHSD
jgi:hypothetical protein